MALSKTRLKEKMNDRIYNSLKKSMKSTASQGKDYVPVADVFWKKLADCISDIAMDIVDEMKDNAEVKEGIPGAAGPTTGPGKIE